MIKRIHQTERATGLIPKYYLVFRSLMRALQIQGAFFSAFLLVSLTAHASPPLLTYQGRIVKSDGVPLEYSNVAFIFQIANPSGSCVIYQEQVTGFDMSGSKGVFDVPIGSGTVSWPTGGGFSILDAFNNNSNAYSCGICSGYSCTAGSSTYSPLADAGRVLKVQFYDGNGWKVISPNTLIRSVPYAGYAMSAQKLGLHESSAFVLKDEVNGSISCAGGSQFLTWNATTKAFGCSGVSGGAGGTVTEVTAASPLSVTNGQSTPHITILPASGSQNGYLSSGDWNTFNNKLGAATIFAGDVSGTSAALSVDKLKNVSLSMTSLTAGDFLKYSGGQWINSGLAVSDLTGVLPIASGGTGASSQSGAINSLLPAQTGNANKILQTDGTNVSWADTPATGITALTGEVTASGSGSVAATIANNAVTSAKILNATILGEDVDFTGVNSATSSFVMKDSTGKFYNFACSTTGHVPTWTVAGFACQAPSAIETDPKVGANTLNMLSKWDGSALVASGVYESGGSVGIGTASPGVALDVAGVVRTGSADTIKDAAHTGLVIGRRSSQGGIELNGGRGSADLLSSYLQFFNNNSNIAEINARTGTGATSGALTFHTSVTGTSTEKMRIDQLGNIGIGTVAPNSKLTVEGGITLRQQGSDPAGTASYGSLYTKTDGKLYYRDGTGTISDLTAGGGGGGGSGGDFKADGSVPMSGDFNLAGYSIVDNDLNTINIGDGVNDQIMMHGKLNMVANLNLAGYSIVDDDTNQIFIGDGMNDTITLQGQVNLSSGGINTNGFAIADATGALGVTLGDGVDDVILLNGKVGIGTPTPQSELDVRGQLRVDFICASDGSNCKDTTTSWSAAGTGNVTGPALSTANAAARFDGTTGALLKDSKLVIADSGQISVSGGVGTNTLLLYDSGGGIQMAASAAGTKNISLQGSTVLKGTNSTSASAALNATNSSNTSLLYVRNDGQVGIGTTAPAHQLHVVGTAGLSTGTAWTNTSDARLKDVRGNYSRGLQEILKLRTVRFNYKPNNSLGLPSDKEIVGFVAQEVQQVIPEAVVARKDGYLELNVDPIHWASVNAIQEIHGRCEMTSDQLRRLAEEVSHQDREIASLKNANAVLVRKLEALEDRFQRMEKILRDQK